MLKDINFIFNGQKLFKIQLSEINIWLMLENCF